MSNSNTVYLEKYSFTSPNITVPKSIALYGLSNLPSDIRSDLENNYYEPGVLPPVFKYFESLSAKFLENIMQDICIAALREKKHRIIWNIMVILSEFPYENLGEWAAFLAEAALKSPYPDVIELGIRCFENWEDREACKRLKRNSFKESWLNDYAEEVCEYIEKNGKNETFFTNYNWECEQLRDNKMFLIPA